MNEVPGEGVRVVGGLFPGPVKRLPGVMLLIPHIREVSDCGDGVWEVIEHPRGDGVGFPLGSIGGENAHAFTPAKALLKRFLLFHVYLPLLSPDGFINAPKAWARAREHPQVRLQEGLKCGYRIEHLGA